MKTISAKTDLSCGSCVRTLKNFISKDEAIKNWNVNLDSPDKILTVSGENISETSLKKIVEEAGFHILGFLSNKEERNFFQTYKPILLIFLFITGFVILSYTDPLKAMSDFMAGFFVIFSFFKLLNLKGFVDAYKSYDIIAKKFPSYGYLYPFLELALGILYFKNWAPVETIIFTISLMGISSVGVIISLIKGQKITCACLGTFFNLPMSTVTLIEDLLMLVMAVAMLVTF